MSWAARFLIRQYLRESLWVVPFLGPVIVLLLGGKGKKLLPKVRDWMNANSWIVSERIIGLFVVVTASSL